MIGWDGRSKETRFVTVQRSRFFGMFKVVAHYPLTDEGWSRAWQDFMSLQPDQGTVERTRVALAARAESKVSVLAGRELAARTLAAVPEVIFLGGYSPDALLVARQSYDLRFLDDRLSVSQPGQAVPLADLAYAGIRSIEIGGPGLVRSGGGFFGGGRGVAGAAEGMAIAAMLNAVTTRTRIKTIIQIQATDSELFFLNTRTTPQDLRIHLSRCLGAVRNAQAAAQPAVPDSQRTGPGPGTVVDELERLARLHETGMITAEEFARMKARLMNGK